MLGTTFFGGGPPFRDLNARLSDPPNAIARRPENGTQDRSAAVAMVHVKLKNIVSEERKREKGGKGTGI